jgi:ABC-2 type transport system ATP-binding protein
VFAMTLSQSLASPADPTLAVWVEDLTKRFVHRSLLRRSETQVVTALESVSFSVERGEIFGILGANGSGKSTLIRVLSTLLIPDRGAARVLGYDVVQDAGQVKRLINRVSVEASFFKRLSAMENLLYASRLYGRHGRGLRADIVATLGRLGIEPDQIDQPLEEFSRGMQQKVAIARAFLTSPILLLLDEPTTGLDPRSKRDVQALVRQLRAEHDATILLCTHDLDEAEALCDRIAVLDRGHLVAVDTPEGLKALVTRHGAGSPSLEEAFLALTGHVLEAEPAGEPG